jgi:hypothetical protein
VEVLGPRQGDGLPPALDAWDAWDGARQGATDAEVRRALVGAVAEKLADRGQAGRVLDELCQWPELRIALQAERAWAALCRPDVAPSEAQSYVAREVAEQLTRTAQQDATQSRQTAAQRTKKSRALPKKLLPQDAAPPLPNV